MGYQLWDGICTAGGCHVGHNRVCWALMLGADLGRCQPERWLLLHGEVEQTVLCCEMRL